MVRCVAALLTLLALAACTTTRDQPRSPNNLLLVTIDTMRADRLGRGFTPVLDGLGNQGLRFTQARSVVPLTLPSHVSIMTGLLPSAHGIRLNGGARPAGATLAMRLKTAGYTTAAVVGAFVLDRRFGLDAGFDEYDDRIARDPTATDRLQADRRAGEVIDRALTIVNTMPVDRPWFQWVHVYDPHAPYDPPSDARARAAGDAYNGEIAFVDKELGRLFAALDARPDAARSARIVVGDHGESLGEHGEPTHGMLLFEPAVCVPLLISGPGIAPRRSEAPVTTLDILPTALALTGQTGDASLAGRNLVSEIPLDRESFSETEYPTVAGWTALRALVQDRWKLVIADRPVLFDLQADPGESADIASTRTTLVQAMSQRIDTMSAAKGVSPPAAAASISVETSERLRSLGYVAPTASPVKAAGGVNPAAMMAAWAAFESALDAMNGGRPGDAVATLAKLSTTDPASPIFQSTYARALAASGKKTQALGVLRSAVKRWPTDASLYHELAVLARELGLSDEAARAEEAALLLNASDPAAHNGKGLLLVEGGRTAEAASAFEDALRLDPNNAVYAANLGNARRALGDLSAAITAYRRALSIAPELADAANGLGAVLVQQKQLPEAIRWLQVATKEPGFVEAQLNLGIAFQESGDLERARAQYRQVLESKGHARERDAARALLAQLDRR